jgi:hypothetical protein
MSVSSKFAFDLDPASSRPPSVSLPLHSCLEKKHTFLVWSRGGDLRPDVFTRINDAEKIFFAGTSSEKC